MIHLHYANRLESLIAPLSDAIAAQQRARPLERVTIVVPNRVVEQFLQHRISEAIGIAANLEFPFLRRFLAEIIEKTDPKIRILDVEELQLVLFESLRGAVRDNPGDFRAPLSYIEKDQPTEAEKELRAFRLARQLARLFRDYSIARRPMLQRWMRSDDAPGEERSDTERWQRQLWRSIFDQNGLMRRQLKQAETDSDWMPLPDAFEAVRSANLKAALPPAVHVFGLAYAGPAYLRILSQLGNLTELYVYALNPCLEFWEDVEDLSRTDRASWSRRRAKVGGELEQSTDPFNLEAAADTPALRLWARPGREYIRMLNEATECDFYPLFVHQNSRAPSLLANLQEDILNRAPERIPGTFNLPDHGSLRFLACPGIAREAEIVANEIWSMLEHDSPGAEALRFHQIAVIVPDAQYPDYLPHIESAFTRLHQLPMNIVHRGVRSAAPVWEAIALLLRLPLGRLSRDEMLHLLNHPAISGNDPELETDQAARWCEELGIFFGADARDFANTYIPPDTYHWDQGIRRLALGVFMGNERDREPRFYRAPGSLEYLPCAASQDEISAVATFISNSRKLLIAATEIRSHRLTLTQWSRLLSELIVTYIQVDDPAEERIRERCVEAIESLAQPDLSSTSVYYQVAHELISARLEEMESQLSRFTAQGIAIGPLSALRAIPFEVIFLLGLNEAHFPERDRRDPMDLRVMRRKAGDVTPTERDRYLFLETLIAARRRICMSYVARDAKTGDRLDPSSAVRELQFILRGYLNDSALDALTIEHPLSRYDRGYFPDLREDNSGPMVQLNSYDSAAHHGAAMAALRSDLTRHCEGLPLPGRDEPLYEQLRGEAQAVMRHPLGLIKAPSSSSARNEVTTEMSLSISALRKFLECPLQGAAQHVLGIFEDDNEELEQWQDEPIAQSVLDRTNLLRDTFWKARGDRKLLATEYAKAIRISQLVGAAPGGPFAEAAQRIDLQSMETWIEQAHVVDCGNLTRWCVVRMGRGDDFATVDRILEELSLPVRVTGRAFETQPRVAKIHGSMGFISPAGDASLRLVLRDKPKVKDFLAGFLSAIVLAAVEQLPGKRFHSIVIGAGKHRTWSETRSLICPTAEEARAYLSHLLSDLLFDKNHYFLPIEAVEDIYGDIARGNTSDLLDTIYDVCDNDFASCSSDYGPIRNARRFEPPGIEALQSILERRFRIIRRIFEPERH